MIVLTESERVRLARKVVLELLFSAVDLSTAPELEMLLREYGGQRDRFGRACERVSHGLYVDNPLYVRDYQKCVLCYKCVEACGVDAQNTFAIAVASRGFEAGIATEWNSPLPESACVYCGNCIAVCPTGALMAKTEFDLRREGRWEPERQTTTETICGYCGVGCTIRLHVQDGRIVKATAPFENFVTRGNLCVKGRFGFAFVHALGEEAEASTQREG
jgi:predicted molibdopterin-dependent oxidoreductase YjgC